MEQFQKDLENNPEFIKKLIEKKALTDDEAEAIMSL